MGVKLLTSLFELLTLELSSSRDDARSSAMGILEHLPTDDRLITEMMVEGGLVPVVMGILEKAVATDKCTIKRDLLESTMGVLLRFTHPSDVSLQRYLADRGIIPVLIRLLSSGSPVVRCRAAASLGQLSETTSSMACHSSSAKKKNKKKERVYYWCIGAPVPHPDPSCKVHGGTCSIEKSFCLLEGQALPSLIRSLEDKELAVVEEVLGALATLLHDEFWEAGANAIAQERGVGPIIRLLTTGTPRAQETALWILERFFRKSTFRERYGSSAQMAVISLAQDGTNKARDSAARILAHMNILQEQSSYF
jgi:vacuolar protein 8